MTSQLRFEALSSSLNLNGLSWALGHWSLMSLEMARYPEISLDILIKNGATLVRHIRGTESSVQESGLRVPLFFEAFAKILLKCVGLRAKASGVSNATRTVEIEH